MPKRVEATQPKRDAKKAIDISYERGKAVTRVGKIDVCACLSRPPKKRQLNEGSECASCNKPIPTEDGAGRRCGYCLQDPADHVHASCATRFTYACLFKRKTYIYKRCESNCHWCGVRSPDHLPENCRHKKYAAHQEALGVKTGSRGEGHAQPVPLLRRVGSAS